MFRMIFVNIAVKDLKKSMEFFSRLGFEFNPQFTDEKAACMVINPQACVMLLSEPFFKGFLTKEPCNTQTTTEAALAFSCVSRNEVDEMVKKALANGGKPALKAQDHGFMYGWSFYDLDGHLWEPCWMDAKAIQS
jgi:predicted lactoylglutathione lyase